MHSSSRRHNFSRQQQPLLSSAAVLPLLIGAVVLALCVVSGSGSPVVVGEAMPDGPARGGEPSGDKDQPRPTGDKNQPRTTGGAAAAPDAPVSTSPFWRALISATAGHEKQFKEEFLSNVKYQSLEDYDLPSFPAGCPSANFSKESCLKRLVQGLLQYRVLLKHVESQYPNNPILPEARFYGERLTSLLRNKMRRPEQLIEQSAGQERELLGDLSDPAATEFKRKLTAHAVLRHMHLFLIDGQRALARREVRASRQRHASSLQPL